MGLWQRALFLLLLLFSVCLFLYFWQYLATWELCFMYSLSISYIHRTHIIANTSLIRSRPDFLKLYTFFNEINLFGPRDYFEQKWYIFKKSPSLKMVKHLQISQECKKLFLMLSVLLQTIFHVLWYCSWITERTHYSKNIFETIYK